MDNYVHTVVNLSVLENARASAVGRRLLSSK